jgi:hypothetical protein
MSPLLGDLTADEQALVTQLRALEASAEADGEQILADAKSSGSALWTALVGAVNAAKAK